MSRIMLAESINALWLRIRALFRRRQLERDLDAELAFHLAMREQKLAESGVPAEEAPHAARRQFGNAMQAKEANRELWTFPFLESIWQDIRYGLRMLRKSPGFTAIAILTLALGIGANTAIFSAVDAALLRPFPVKDSSQLVDVFSRVKHKPWSAQYGRLSYPEYQDLVRQSSSFSGLLAYQTNIFVVESEDGSQIVPGAAVTGSYFDTLGVQAAVGGTFDAAEVARPGGSGVAVIGYDFWQTHFGGNRNVLGKTIDLTGHLFTVVGVAPASFNGMAVVGGPEIWVPLTEETARAIGTGSVDAGVVGRLKPGVTMAQAQAEMSVIARRLARQYPKTANDQTIILVPANRLRLSYPDPEVNRTLNGVSLLLMAVVGLVLLIACANVASMSLARAASRRKEMAVRMAVGAGRWLLVRQLITESLLLALAGGVGAMGVTVAADRLMLGIPSSLPTAYSALNLTLGLQVDYRVLLFTLIVALLATALFGVAPALEASRSRPSDALKEEGRGGGEARHHLLNGLVVVQVAFSLVLLACAGLCLRSAFHAYRVQPGFDPRGVVVAGFVPAWVGYKPAQSAAFYEELLRRVKALPGVRGATLASMVPLAFGSPTTWAAPSSKAPSAPRSQWTQVGYSDVSAGYFGAMGIPILRGRPFRGQDAASTPRVAIVNEALAARFWPGEDPIGRFLRIEKEDYEVVGVAATGKYFTLGEKPRPFVYRSQAQTGDSGGWLVVRSSASPASMLASIRQIGRQIDPKVPAAELDTLSRATGQSRLLPKLAADFFGLAGLLGLALVCVGLYGAVSYSVNQRIHEIGIRVALGAQRSDIAWLVLRRSLELTLLGVGIGLGGAFAVTRVLSSILYGISAADPVTFVGVPLLLVLVALAACFAPIRRAMRVDPVTALKYE